MTNAIIRTHLREFARQCTRFEYSSTSAPAAASGVGLFRKKARSIEDRAKVEPTGGLKHADMEGAGHTNRRTSRYIVYRVRAFVPHWTKI